MARLTFHGAAREVTGSCHLLETEQGGRILLDCGMHQGGDAVERLQDEHFPFDPADIDMVLLSHAHLDHSGLLPRLFHEGFRGPVMCTHATVELLDIMLRDAVGLYLRDLERNNLRRARRGQAAEEAVYELSDVDGLLQLCQGHAYAEPVAIGETVTVNFHDAGHILGSSIIEVQLDEGGQTRSLVFSGDLGKQDSVLMNAPAVLSQADVVLLESTYGDREHRGEQDSLQQLRDVLRDTWEAGGTVMIPSFAVGRTQDVLFHLCTLHQQGELDNWQIFLDSPMAIAVTRVYDRWLAGPAGNEVRNLSETQRMSLEDFLPTLNLCRRTEESMAINRVKSGAIIIAGSGMCTGGRIRHHFKQRIWDERNTLIFTGYQARGTLGRILVDGAQQIKLFGEPYVVKARIETLGGLSAHAGQRELLQWVGGFDKAAKVQLVHGELEAQQLLADKIAAQLGLQVDIPGRGESITF